MALLPCAGNPYLFQCLRTERIDNLRFGVDFGKFRRFPSKDMVPASFLFGGVGELRWVDFYQGKMCRNVITCASSSGKKLKNNSEIKERHLWMKRDSAGSGQKALNLVRIISKLSNEKEVVYGALDKWAAWETEFPLIAAAKAMGIFRKRSQWLHIIQISKWMLNKGQGMTMGTYDILLLAFDMDGRIEEAENVWNMILQKYNRSVSKRLFSRMISLYDHHHLPDKVLEVFADMEELGVRPDEDTIRRVGYALQTLGLEDKQKQLLQKYERRWKYLHFKGERVRMKSMPAWDQ